MSSTWTMKLAGNTEVQNHTPSSYVKIYLCHKDSINIDDQPQSSDAPSTSENITDRQVENLEDYLLTRDIERRTRQPSRYARADCIFNYSLEDDNKESSSFEEALNGNEKDEWLAIMKGEINTLHKNETWELTIRHLNKGVIPCKWVYKKKF